MQCAFGTTATVRRAENAVYAGFSRKGNLTHNEKTAVPFVTHGATFDLLKAVLS